MGKEIDVDLLGVAMTTGQGVLTMNEVFFVRVSRVVGRVREWM